MSPELNWPSRANTANIDAMEKKVSFSNRFGFLGLVFSALLVSPVASFAQQGWSTACSASASIEDVSLTNYRFSGPSLMHKQGTTGIVRARYNVVNTSFS